MTSKPLSLYEEVMLLALRDEQGTVAAGFVEHAVAGAILAELLLDGRINIDSGKKQLVTLKDCGLTGDPVVDECVEKIATATRDLPLKTWISRLAGIRELRHKVARRLCDRGILRADEDKVLFLFSRRIYPEINPQPELEIIERLRNAIFTEMDNIDPRTVVLVSLAQGADVLAQAFPRRELRSRKKRIEQVVNGELSGKATKEVIEACQTAIMVAAIMPAIFAASVHS